MNKMLKHSLQMGVAFFIIGVALALAAPTVAAGIGFTGEALAHITTANAMPIWTGTFFGMFGALSAVVPPVVGKLLGLSDKPSETMGFEQDTGGRNDLQQEIVKHRSAGDMDVSTNHAAKLEAGRRNSCHSAR